MGFSCGWDYDGDRADVWSETEHVARKRHTCSECRGDISPGDTYGRIFTLFDGEPETTKLCERCYDLKSSFSDLGYCYVIGSLLGDYADWLEEGGLRFPRWLSQLGWRPWHLDDEGET